MDNLLEALKTGSAFAVNRERKGERRRTPRAAGGMYSHSFRFLTLCTYCIYRFIYIYIFYLNGKRVYSA